MKPRAHTAAAGDEELRPLQHHAQLGQVLQPQRSLPTGGDDAPGADRSDARHPQQSLQVRLADLHRELLQVAQGPMALGVQQGIEVRVGLVQQLLGLKAVKPQQPVRLV